jgi:hypothetical protein
MKILLVLLLILWGCNPAPASDNKTMYNTSFIMQWAFDCVNELRFHFLQQGMPMPYASIQAGMHCSCVIDQFRLNYTQKEVLKMTPADRLLFSHQFTKQCLGEPDATI